MMAHEERQIRVAAETLLSGSLDSQRSSYTQSINRTPDTVFRENIIAGARTNGSMSNVRRFFCLFVTFDFFFTCLMWLICTVISGQSLPDAFKQQIIYYNVKTSLFDVVMAAFCRFVVLLLFYALLYIRHWIIIALSTSISTGFLMSKVFLFDWPKSSQPGFQVLLIITSFVIAWGEVWFFVFRDIPLETQARDWFLGATDNERAPLLRPNLSNSSQQHENIHNFYTPMDSPDHSDVEEDPQRRTGRLNTPFTSSDLTKIPEHKILDYYKKADNLAKRSYEIFMSQSWVLQKTTDCGDEVYSMILPKPDGKIFKITGIINASARQLRDYLFEDVEGAAKWNKKIFESRIISKIDDNTDIIYQATHKHGQVHARDFVILRHRYDRDCYFISAGISIISKSVPARSNYIRGENGVNCWVTQDISDENRARCRFTWVMNTNLKGWMPQKLVEVTTSLIMQQFMSNLRDLAQTMPGSQKID